ncbi:MAG TPA: hypothetical protein VLC74_04130 [Rhizomicrobium sp.]|nr:hypothetical protein [Rhizomicrobium sp.]
MRATLLLASAAVILSLNQATAQPTMRSMDPLVTTNVAYDDLNCAARYTLAAFAIHDLDLTAAAYYAERASAAGQRYMALHPGETQQSYMAQMTANAQNLQQRLTTNAITPESLVAEIKRCDQDADTRIVT